MAIVNTDDRIRFDPTPERPAQLWRLGADGPEAAARVLAEEAPVGLGYDGKPHVVLMATPQDIEDLAVGFTVTERIASLDQIRAVEIVERAEGFSVDITLDATARASRLAARARSMEGRSSCGLCGLQRLTAAVRPLEPVGEGLRISRYAVQAALAALEDQQAMGRLTRSMHAAAWADASGALKVVREDVGRHNALDKLIGAGLKQGLDAGSGFAVVTSRCSYEMVEKAAMAGFPVLVAISAPTALAIRKAEEAGLTLVALARADGHMVFSRPDRIVEEAVV